MSRSDPTRCGMLDAPSPLERAAKRTLLFPLVNRIIPAALLRGVVRKSPLGAESLARPGGWRALELCYQESAPLNIVDRLVSRSAFFPRAARNRRVIAVAELAGLIRERGKAALVMSLGSGPGRCEMEAMGAAGSDGCRLLCIDRDRAAFGCGCELRRRFGLEGRVSFVEGDASRLAAIRAGSVDIVTLLGFLGYFDDDALSGLLGEVYRVLKTGGAVLTNSITDAHGVDGFMERVFDWTHHYRPPSVVQAFLEEAGFEKAGALPEPFGVYSIMTGRKP